MSGGGEVKLSRLDDVQSSTAKVDGQFLKYDASQKKWVGGAVDLNSIVGAAPETLDTLVELAAAINNDDDFATTIADSIATKVSQTDLDTHTTNTNNPHAVTATQVGLGNVTNESKATMFTNPAFTGNVGIGTSSPSKKLDVVGDIEASGDIQAQTMTVGGAINANTIGGTISTPAQPNITSVGTLTTLTVSNDADFNGNLDVDQTINTTQITAIMGTIGGATFGSSDTSHSYDFVVDTDTFVVDTTENKVGIGTTSPTEKLEVSGDLMLQQNGVIKNKNNNTQFRFGVNDLYLDAGHVRAGYSVGIRGNRGSTKGMEQGSTLNSDLGIYCGGNEAISIHSDGDTLVNNDLEVEGTTTVGKITLSDNSFVTETADFTMGETHRGATVLLQNTGPITITVPSQVAGHTTTFIAETSNSVVFTSGTGLSAFNSFNSANQIAGIFGQAQIIFKSSTEAFLGGNVV